MWNLKNGSCDYGHFGDSVVFHVDKFSYRNSKFSSFEPFSDLVKVTLSSTYKCKT